MVKRMAKALDTDLAERLQIIRIYSGSPNQTAFAARFGFEIKSWNNYERGFSLPSWAAIQLVQKFPGLTLDWIYLGKEDGLPGRLRAELAEAAEMLTTSAGETARKRG